MRPILLSILSLFLLAGLIAGEPTPPPGAEGEETPVSAPEIVEALRPSAVRVRVWARRDEGEDPLVSSLAQDLDAERPTLWGGWMWDANTVLVEDPVLHARFVRKIEVEAGGKTVEARVKGVLLRHPSLLLELSGPLPAKPLEFGPSPDPEACGELRIARYDFSEQESTWNLAVLGGPQGYVARDGKDGFWLCDPPGVAVDLDGLPVGLLFAGRLGLGPDAAPWTGEALRREAVLGADAMKEKLEAVATGLRASALEVRFRFRVQVEDGDENPFAGMRAQRRFRRGFLPGGFGAEGAAPELVAAGFLVAPSRLLVPVALPREILARLEGVEVETPEGGKPARFAGALREFQAVLVDLDGAPGRPLPLGGPVAFRPGELFLTAHIDFSQKKRREILAYDRCRGFFRSTRDLPGVWTFTNEDDGSVAFSLDGAPLGIALAHRPRPTGEERNNYDEDGNSMFRPLALVAAALAAPDAIDATLKPLAEEDEKRLVWFGAETQRLDVELARRLGVEQATRGGEIGLLLQHVYAGSPLAEAGVREGDILLRLEAPGQAEPIEFGPAFGETEGGFDFSLLGDVPEEARESFLGRMPPPWPPRNDSVTMLLTEIGEGREVKVEYARAGEVHSFRFVTRFGPPDFRSAAKFKSRELGLTVKEMTYEVCRFLRRADAKAVVVAKVEPGCKAAVAGIGPYELITRIDGHPISGLEDFRRRAEALAGKGGTSVELTLESFGKTRLVRIDL